MLRGDTVSRRLVKSVAILMASMAMIAVSCSSGDVSQEDLDAAKADLSVAQTELQQVRVQLDTAQSEVAQLNEAQKGVTVQVGQAQPAAPDAIMDDWATEYSVSQHVTLLETFDSSGPPAWDPVAHPNVFITSEGEGYAGFVSETYKGAGLHIIDAVTKEHVASAEFDLGYDTTGEPHGLGVSPDGKWIYVPTADGGAPWQSGPRGGRLLVVNSETLKLHQVISTGRGPHHVKAFTDWEGNDRVIVEIQGGGILLLDPKDDNRVAFAVGTEEFKAESYQADADPAGKYLYVNLHLGSRGVAPELQAAVGKVDLETGRISYITGVGHYTNGFAFTSDGKFTYVAESVTDHVYKIDNATNKVVAKSQAGVPGPYMIELNDDETELWVVGKGEMTFNLGGSLGLVDTRSFRAVNAYDIGGQTIDHNIVNPFATNEMWVTSSGTANTIVFDMETREVISEISTPNGGDTHSGAFVEYQPDFTGVLLADNTGRKDWFLQLQKDSVAAIAAAR
jgi:DNA-binding beta-propeller fold protein YncE